jgi:hypothetical protein
MLKKRLEKKLDNVSFLYLSIPKIGNVSFLYLSIPKIGLD